MCLIATNLVAVGCQVDASPVWGVKVGISFPNPYGRSVPYFVPSLTLAAGDKIEINLEDELGNDRGKIVRAGKDSLFVFDDGLSQFPIEPKKIFVSPARC